MNTLDDYLSHIQKIWRKANERVQNDKVVFING